MFQYTAFDHFKIIAHGTIDEVALTVREHKLKNKECQILVFSDCSGNQMDLDLSGSEKDVLARLKIYKTETAPKKTKRPGRPKLGVVAREISLLPKHWEWLSNQSGGASATIRRLISEKMKDSGKAKEAQHKVYAFLHAIAGNLTNFEEAVRYLYRGDKAKFESYISEWPKDLVQHTRLLAKEAFNDD